jgi:hypothetical protein
VRYRVAGRLRKLTIGPFPRINVADARKQARKAFAAVDSGRDPQGEKVAARKAEHAQVGDLLEDVIKRFLATHAKRNLRESSQREVARILNG